jgi:hypothetical protein
VISHGKALKLNLDLGPSGQVKIQEGSETVDFPAESKAMERSTIFHGKIHYFAWAIFNSYFDITRG